MSRDRFKLQLAAGQSPGSAPVRWREVLAVLALFAVLSVIYTHPLSLHLATAVEDGQDALLNVWIMAWDTHALLTDPLHLFDANIFVPFARTLAFSEINLSQALLAMPFTLASGNPVLGYNVALLLTFVLSGLGACLLAFRLTGSRLGGIAAGVIFAFNAYKLSNLAQIQLLSLYWLPFALIFLDRILCPAPAAEGAARRGWLDVAAAAVFLALQALASFYYAMFAAFAAALFVVCRLCGTGRLPERAVVLRLAVAALLACAVVLPFAVPYFQVQQELGFQRSLADSEPFSAALSLYAQTLANNVLYGKWLAPSDPVVIGGYPLDALFPGAFVLCLAVFGVVPSLRRWKDSLFYPLLALISFVLSLGPALYLTPELKADLPFSLPYAWLYNLVPGFGAFRAPERFSILVFLGLAVLAAFGVSALSRRRRGLPVAMACVLLVGLECLVMPAAQVHAVPTGDQIPAVYRWLAQQPSGTILELPLGGQDALRTLRYQYFSTYHWQRTPDGYSGFIPGAHGEMVYEMGMFPGERSLALLRAYGVERVVIHGDQMPSPPADALPGMALEATFGADRVYRVQQDSRPAILTLGAYLPEQAASGAPYTAYLIARSGGQLPRAVLPTHLVQVRATWSGPGGKRQDVARVRLPIVTSGASVVPVPLTAPAGGAESLTLEVDDPELGRMMEQRALRAGVPSLQGRAFPVPVRLVSVGTDKAAYQPGEPVQVRVRWRALGKIDAYYSAFAAITGPDGRTVDRQEGEPQMGKRPTLLWAPGEEIDDQYTLRLPAGSAPGRYLVEVGLYRASDLAPAMTLDEAARPVARLFAAPIKIPLQVVKARPETAANVRLGESITLLGFGRDLRDGILDLTLFWRAGSAVAVDYTVFVQALAADGRVAAQSDSQPVAGTYPTSIWSPDEIIADSHRLTLPPGEYRLVAGMYELATMKRLPVGTGDTIPLFDLKVLP